MTNDVMLGGLYILMAAMLIVGTLIARREPLARMATMALTWIALFGAGFILFTFRDDLGLVAQRLRSEATGAPVIAGQELRIPMAIDGHFWVNASINGHDAQFLVDSGASITSISSAVAGSAGVETGMRVSTVETANGEVQMRRASVDRFAIGQIVRSDFTIHVNDHDDTNVLGMNFLSSLGSWRVEGNYLVLRP